ncbi:MAG: hypothetical protein R3190_00220 [Thermoanaerobaculia bacterium]|nr:hypothetical protein [Thermoanaerobaculia bacterium]
MPRPTDPPSAPRRRPRRPADPVRDLVGVAAALALLAGLTWGLLRFGATREPDLYGLWIWLTPAVVSGLVLLVRSRCRGASVIVLLTAGALLASAVWLRPTFSARGFTHLCIGWSALLVGYALARSGRRLTMLLFALLIVVGLAEIGYGALQHFDVVEGVLGRQGWGDLASGTLINPNHFAGLVNMTMLLSVGAAFSPSAAPDETPSSASRSAGSWSRSWSPTERRFSPPAPAGAFSRSSVPSSPSRH